MQPDDPRFDLGTITRPRPVPHIFLTLNEAVTFCKAVIASGRPAGVITPVGAYFVVLVAPRRTPRPVNPLRMRT